MHVGTGIRDPRDYTRALRCFGPLLRLAREAGLRVEALDVGGGFASPTSRELTAFELLRYQGTGRNPSPVRPERAPGFEAFARAVHDGVRRWIPDGPLPRLLVEPGRCIASPNQLLLLMAHRIKERPGVGRWIVTDGGLGTVTMPTYYEVHEILLANDVRRPRAGPVTVLGPGCFAGDVVYRNKRLPDVRPGEVLAVMDSGAYFTALESTFGHPRPAVVSVAHGSARLVRRRESFEDMRQRDALPMPQSGRTSLEVTP
jgi:diaminopimelate decarboxylase